MDYYNNVKQEIDEVNAKIKNYDTELQKLEEEHRMELKVYDQKVRRLEYIQSNECVSVESNSKKEMISDKEAHIAKTNELIVDKKAENSKFKEKETANIKEISKNEAEFTKRKEKLNEVLDTIKNDLITNYEKKLKDLKNELELRLKVEIHEIEERMNQHINELMRNHEKEYRRMKDYYNDITRSNLNDIKHNREMLYKIRQQINENTTKLQQIREEKKTLKDPLDRATQYKDAYLKQLKSHAKDKMSLANAQAQKEILLARINKITADKNDLDKKFDKAHTEKDDMYKKFEIAMKILTSRAEYKNKTLEIKLRNMEDEYTKKEVQLQETVKKVPMDPKMVEEICKKMEESIEAKNAILRNLRYSLSHAQKAYNDAIRVYEAKLIEFGIPAEELGLELLETNTSTMPAGFVAA